MQSQWIQASGYLAVLLMPALFLIGALLHRPWLAFAVVVFVFPLARSAFGALPASGVPEWREGVATALDRLPLIYVPVLIGCALSGLYATAVSPDADAASWLGLGLSLWLTLLFATCVAHELIHRRDRRQAMLGHVLAGICGYPVLGIEHLTHHARPGDSERAEVPTVSESMWGFAARRLRRIGAEFLGPMAAVWRRRSPWPGHAHVHAAIAATALTAAIFALLAGAVGLLLYAAMIAGVSFGVQLITYIQHWGLGVEEIGERVARGRGWEEDCRFQAWTTLSTSLHDRHHADSRLPFYRLSLSSDSPRLPAGYVLLMFASMVPPLWRRVMLPTRARWLAQPDKPMSAGRRLTCFGRQIA